MSIPNYIPPTKQWEINTLIDEILLLTDKSYPHDSVIDIIRSFIPDVSIVEHDFDGDLSIRGAVFKKSATFQRPIIAVQKKQTKEAKTFTLAHEFGHYCLDHVGASNFMIDQEKFDGSAHMQREAEAQYFAASLLMPVDKFMKLSGYLTTHQLAKRFGVSESAVSVRRAWLGGKKRDEAL